MSRVNLADLTPPAKTEPARASRAQTQERPVRKQMSLYLPYFAWRRIRRLAFEEERSIHSLVLEGLDLLLAQRGQPSIADLVRKGERG